MANGLFGWQANMVTNRPGWTIAIILLLSVAFGSGLLVDNSVSDATGSFLDEDSELAQAQDILSDRFGGMQTDSFQIVLRGDVFDKAVFDDMIAFGQTLRVHPDYQDLLVEAGIFGAGHVYLGALQANYSAATTQDLLELPAAVQAAASALLLDEDGLAKSTAAVMFVSFPISEEIKERYLDEEAGTDYDDLIYNVDALAKDYDWSNGVDGRSFSSAKLNVEVNEAQGSTTAVLMLAALGVIFLLLIVFYRQFGDVLVTTAGLVLTIVWAIGLQGILVFLQVVQPGNSLGTMIPVLLIGLCVDYALQVTGRYREEMVEQGNVRVAMRRAVIHSGVPLLLAAFTTIISFLTNLTSNLPPTRDFGILAAVGVFSGWFVMTTFVPSMRRIFDARKEAKGKRIQLRALTDAIPGAGAFTAGIGKILVKAPVAVLGVMIVITGFAAFGAANVSTTFNQTDFLPEDTESYEDITLLPQFGTGTSKATILIRGDLYEDLTVRNVLAFYQGLNDVNTRPEGMTGPVEGSLFDVIGTLAQTNSQVADVVERLSTQFTLSREDFLTLYKTIEQADGGAEALATVFDGDVRASVEDYTILRIPLNSEADTHKLVRDIERLWRGEEDAMTVTGSDVLLVAVTDAMTESQLQSIVLTIVAAVIVLMLFFGIVERHAILGIIAVVPIAIVVAWVLGTMYLLGISYNVLTALITALTIGVGVDYTIHITHRFTEELDEGKGIQHAVTETLQTTGGALLGSGLTTALGFGVLLFSDLVPMRQFGGLTAITIVYSLLASFIVLPPMLVLWALFKEYRERGEERPKRAATGAAAPANMRKLSCPKCGSHSMIEKNLLEVRCPRIGCTYRARAKS